MNVLVCEDDATMSFIINHYLKSLGHEVVTVDGLESAVEKINENLPDVIITDYILEDKSGLDVINYVTNFTERLIPVILISALDLTMLERNEGIKFEGVFLRKPFTRIELEEKMAKVI